MNKWSSIGFCKAQKEDTLVRDFSWPLESRLLAGCLGKAGRGGGEVLECLGLRMRLYF